MNKLNYYFYFFLVSILLLFPTKAFSENHNLNDNIVFIRLEQFWTEQGREEVVNTITSHVPSMDKDMLTKCIQEIYK